MKKFKLPKPSQCWSCCSPELAPFHSPWGCNGFWQILTPHPHLQQSERLGCLQGAKSSQEISHFLSRNANHCSVIRSENLPQVLHPVNPFWPEISEKTMQDAWAWILTMREGKDPLGLVRERPQGFAAPSGAMQGSPWCSVEVEEPLTGPVESAGPGRNGEEVLYAVHRPCPSLVDICHHLKNGFPGVAEGNKQPISSVGKKGSQGKERKCT